MEQENVLSKMLINDKFILLVDISFPGLGEIYFAFSIGTINFNFYQTVVFPLS